MYDSSSGVTVGEKHCWIRIWNETEGNNSMKRLLAIRKFACERRVKVSGYGAVDGYTGNWAFDNKIFYWHGIPFPVSKTFP